MVYKTPLFFVSLFISTASIFGADKIDFGRDIRPLLSNKCFQCHGPDPSNRKGGDGGEDGFRLDIREGAQADMGGYAGLVPGKPANSEIFLRITSDEADEVMPPPKSGEKLTAEEAELLRRWIEQGGEYSGHWAYQKPKKSAVPDSGTGWAHNEIDHFIHASLEKEELKPSPEADRFTLIRRLSLDITGLPPTQVEVDAFENDNRPDAYERLVDDLLSRSSYGEHWARKWLDLARYADSAGYADDPERVIWAYRDYVIRALNENKPYDQFTIEQLAGDLIENRTEDSLVATAFHRNTQTNSEGGTDDEEFRNVAIVDRVNTTMAVWMGTTMACAQCHTHKYDPITQEEYFKFYAILNNTEDADRRDEAPTKPIFTKEDKSRRSILRFEFENGEYRLENETQGLDPAVEAWAVSEIRDGNWVVLQPEKLVAKSGATMTAYSDGSVIVSEESATTDTYEILTHVPLDKITGIRLEVLTDDSLELRGPGRKGNFVLNEIEISRVPASSEQVGGRFVRIELPGKGKILSLAEVSVFSGGNNVAMLGNASQSSVALGALAERAIDGKSNGEYEAGSVTHTNNEDDPWWEVDLGSVHELDKIEIWNRTGGLEGRLSGFVLKVLDAERKTVWENKFSRAPEPMVAEVFDGQQQLVLNNPSASFSQTDYTVSMSIDGNLNSQKGWAIAPNEGRDHAAVYQAQSDGGKFKIVMHQKYGDSQIGKFRILVTADERPVPAMPINIADIIAKSERTPAEQQQLRKYYAQFDPELRALTEKIASLKSEYDQVKPMTTVPVLRELPKDKQRVTNLQYRGSYLDKGSEVGKGVPAVFNPMKGEPDRLSMAKWLVDRDNPLAARVLVNRIWESIFGYGIVMTSEEFGSQGELPVHPELLDWLAVDTMEHGWDVKRLLGQVVTSAAYRQSSKVDDTLYERDPSNRLLARGPRFRLSAEMIRDQALALSGLLNVKMYGAPVRPMQPDMGLKAAFGGGTDWEVSDGAERYRRGLYTTWRRSNPYPSMATFDAPNREVCVVRRDRTNTPLQALVTLNDPVYIEAAQAMARAIIVDPGTVETKATNVFKRCTGRAPIPQEAASMVALFEKMKARYAPDLPNAKLMAEDPLGPAPEGADLAELAAWTVVSNIILNLDEMLMKR
jgi:hypothetical protein